ncbi:MAG: HAMP domain-containing protein, partial [Phenylobacterium sp.]
MSLNNLNISKKLLVGFAVVVTTVSAMSGAVFFSLGHIRTAIRANDSEVAQINAGADALSALVERQNAVRGFVASGDKTFEGKIETETKAFGSAIARLSKLAPEDAAQIAEMKAAGDEANREEDVQLSQARDPATRAQAVATLTTTGRLTKFREALKAYNDQEQQILQKWSKAQDSSQDAVQMTLAVGTALALLLSVLMGWLLSRAIASPISAMTGAMDKLAGGDHAVDVPAVGRKDEVGR